MQPNDARNYIPLEVVRPNMSPTSLGSFAKCPRHFLFKERFRLTTPRLAEPLVTGQLTHFILAAKLRGLSDPQIEEALKSVQTELTNYLGGLTAPWAASQIDELTQWVAVARVTADHYWRHHALTTDRGFEIIATEKSYVTDTVFGPIKGVVDLLAQDKSGDSFILDFKTSGEEPSKWVEGHPVNWQARVYGFLTQRDPDLTPAPKGIIFVVIQKPSIRWKAWQKWETYLRECRDWYDGNQGDVEETESLDGKAHAWDHRKNKTSFASQPTIHYHPEPFHSNEFCDDESTQVKLEFQIAGDREPILAHFPRTGELTRQCKSRNGACEFRGLCATTPENWERELSYLIRRDEIPSMGDPEDHLFETLTKETVQ